MKKLITLSVLALLSHFASFGQCTISGTMSTCVGATAYLMVDSSLCTGGTWSSSTTTVATVTSYGTTAGVTGVSAGVTTITFTASGGGYTTTTVTVSAAPAAITGTTSFCVGTTTVLSDATAGGTWSSSYTYTATVGSTTGVVTGVHAGTGYIYYTMPGGCYVYATITVESTFGVDSMSGDTILGPSTLCSGSTSSMTCTVSGGTWSSSNLSVATVGSSTGIVTGIATGVANISYTATGTCGTASIYRTVTVNPTISAGSISAGATTIPVSGTTTVYDYYASTTGTWVSSAPSIATVSTSGVVTGVAPGTATIEYVITGCSSTATASINIVVTSLNGISGNVIFPSSYYGYVKVWLITFNTSTLDLEAIDSSNIYCSGTSAHYAFTGLATDSFRVKAATNDTIGTTTGFIPTYHDSSYHWNTANVIYHVSGTSDINEDIHMNIGTVTSGPGFISGNVLSGADKGTSGGTPVVGMLIYVVNSTTGVELQKTYTNASGNYSFSNLPLATYLIYPEAINYATTVYSSITLTSASTSMIAANFKQHTLSKTITPLPTGINNITPSLSTIGVFPNPTSGLVTMQWNETATEKGSVSVTDMTGRELFKANIDMNSGTGNTQLDLSSLSSGLYIISVKSGTINYNTAVSISK